MPLFIAALGIALVTFYIKTRPEADRSDQAVSEVSVPANTTDTAVVPILRAIPVTEATPELTDSELPLIPREGVSGEDFTPWMPPLALDTYIRQKNRGFEKTYWERGHWINAVEGRWNNGTHEFRIALAANPDPEKIQWHYQIDQTEAQFAETLDRLRNEGYTLAQSHAYNHPDGTKRFQGVWQRTLPGSGTTVATQDFIGAANGTR